jgi:Flp pilus assembly protein TadG
MNPEQRSADRRNVAGQAFRDPAAESGQVLSPTALAMIVPDARQGTVGRGRREGGQAMVEFALVLPLLLTLLTAILQFGLMYNKYMTLNDAVRAGARTLSLERGLADPCDDAVTQTVTAAAGTGLSTSQVTATVSGTSNCGAAAYPYGAGTVVQGDNGTVKATVPYAFSVFGVHLGTVTLSASTTDEIE